ncbi:MAG: hypothetical protein COY19_03550 [Candidatus Marinimicrobia bacterium CG_4_10_14_0_2_um_filter_48_9]|nr:MAG: hypothetical protein COY19_03550 [Candidatus Marinimicrobia bacterium CG_4_10_14_0_2_um_filter_48_9]
MQTRENLLDTFLSWLRMPTTDLAPESPLSMALHYELQAAYPNPFNPSVSLKLSQMAGQAGGVHIFDLVGRQIAQLSITQGQQSVTWQPDHELSSGLYFAQLWQAGIPTGPVLKLTFLK